MPGKGVRRTSSAGRCTRTSWPRPGRFFFFIFGLLALLGCLRSDQPGLLYGPYTRWPCPRLAAGLLHGACSKARWRIFRTGRGTSAGHTISWNVRSRAGRARPPVHRRGVVAVPGTLDHGRSARAYTSTTGRATRPPAPPSASRSLPGTGHVAGRRQRRDRRPLQYPLFLIHGDRAIPAVVIGPIVAYFVTKRICPRSAA